MYSASQPLAEFFRTQAGRVVINHASHLYIIIACGLSVNLTQGFSVFSHGYSSSLFHQSRVLPWSGTTKRASNLLVLDYYMLSSINKECYLLTELARILPTNTDFRHNNINNKTAAIRSLNIQNFLFVN